jgi:hypothetical protein
MLKIMRDLFQLLTTAGSRVKQQREQISAVQNLPTNRGLDGLGPRQSCGRHRLINAASFGQRRLRFLSRPHVIAIVEMFFAAPLALGESVKCGTEDFWLLFNFWTTFDQYRDVALATPASHKVVHAGCKVVHKPSIVLSF